jgi:hypothetical protein
VSYLQRLLTTYSAHDKVSLEQMLSETSAAELERLVGVTMTVLAEEAKGP